MNDHDDLRRIYEAEASSLNYQSFLAAYFLLVVRNNRKERRLERLEHSALALFALLGFGTAIAGLPLTLYNSANFWCWIAALPAGCGDIRNDGIGQEGTGCIRGNYAWIYRFAFFYVWQAISFVAITVLMILLYYAVHRQVQKVRRYSIGRSLERKRAQVGVQGMYYIVTFFCITLFSALNRIIQIATGRTYFALALLMMIFAPLQGFWNALIYLRPRYKQYKIVHPNLSARKVLELVLRRALCSSEANRDESDGDHTLGNIEIEIRATTSSPNSMPAVGT